MIEGGRCKRVLESIDDDDGERRIVRIEKEKDQGKALTAVTQRMRARNVLRMRSLETYTCTKCPLQ